jgi:uncharacterized protein YjbI with pentapeptide repeats
MKDLKIKHRIIQRGIIYLLLMVTILLLVEIFSSVHSSNIDQDKSAKTQFIPTEVTTQKKPKEAEITNEKENPDLILKELQIQELQLKIEKQRMELESQKKSILDKIQWPIFISLLTLFVTWRLRVQQRESADKRAKADRENAKTIADAQVKAAQLKEIKELTAKLYMDEEDPNFPKRAAVVALASYGVSAIPTLIASLSSKDELIVKAASNSLQFIGLSAIPHLEQRIRSVPDTNVSSILINVINSLGRSAVNLKKADLTNASLTEADLSGADLTGADLTNANLTDADLTNANLTKADLTKADLTDANLWKADLTDANLWEADLADANLIEADLMDANLTGANLSDAYLTKADLKKANLIGANLTGADLTEADLKEAFLADANLTGADLTEADLKKADLAEADLTGADLRKADLWEANFSGAIFDDVCLKRILDANNWNKAIFDPETKERLGGLIKGAKKIQTVE